MGCSSKQISYLCTDEKGTDVLAGSSIACVHDLADSSDAEPRSTQGEGGQCAVTTILQDALRHELRGAPGGTADAEGEDEPDGQLVPCPGHGERCLCEG